MSQTTGKTSTYIRNANVKESTQTNTGFRNTRFLHKATAGDTLIQLTALVAPTGTTNYSAPSVSDLSQTNLMQWSSNLQLTSSDKGVLIESISYVVTGATTIKLLFEALDGEVFEGKINHQARTGLTLIDAAPLVQSGTLVAGDVDFNVGSPFQVGQYSSTSHGAVLVYVDRSLMYRNTGNNPMGAGVTGDYYEVHSGSGLGQIIRFNSPDLINDRQVTVVSVGSLVERPNGSFMALMESLQGQMDAVVPTVAALAGVPESNFQATPNNIDLKTFGDRVTALEKLPTIQKFLSGSGNYTTPAGVKYIKVTMVGAGAGGAGSGTAAGTLATDGTASTLGAGLLSAGGGIHGVWDGIGGAGGASSLGAATGFAVSGGYGGSCPSRLTSTSGGHGGSSALGGAGAGGNPGAGGGNPTAGAVNTGGGGAGGYSSSTASSSPGSGGGSGGYIEATIFAPAASYSYAVGVGGNAGGAGAGAGNVAGAAGGSGMIIVEEYY